MMSSAQAMWLAFLLFLFIGVIGAAIGSLINLIGRRTWNSRVAVADWATAFAVAAIYGFIGGEVLTTRGAWENNLIEQAILAGSGSVIVKHVLQAAFRSRH